MRPRALALYGVKIAVSLAFFALAVINNVAGAGLDLLGGGKAAQGI